MAHVSANVINDAFRAYDDDVAGGITSQTALFAVDTNWSQDADVKFHVAMLATETAGGAANNYALAVQYRKNGGTWTDLTSTTTDPIYAVVADNCTTSDNTSYGTTALTTGATIQDSEYCNDGGATGNVSLSSSSAEKTTCLIIPSAQNSNSDTIELRLTDNGTPLDADTTIPTITVVVPVPDDLLADDVETTSEVGSPSIGQTHNILAGDVESVSSVESPVIGQVHELLSTGVEATTELTLPVLAEAAGEDNLLADDVESTSEVGSPAITQIHALLSVSIESNSELTLPVVGQVHGLLSTSVESLTGLTLPTLSSASNEDNLLADDVESLSDMTAPQLAQVHQLLATSVESASALTVPVLNGAAGEATFFTSPHVYGFSDGAFKLIVGDVVNGENLHITNYNNKFYTAKKVS